jgi:hypothetical protein
MHVRTQRWENGYYTFGLSGSAYSNSGYFYQDFSNDHLSDGLLTSYTDYVDVLRLNDTLGYALMGEFYCYEGEREYSIRGIELFNGQFTSQIVWENEEYLSSYSRPFFHPMNDSLLLIISGVQCLLVNTHTWEHTSHSFESSIIVDAIDLNDHEILLVDENDIFLFDIFSGNIQTVYQSLDSASEMEKVNENFLRLCYNKFELFDSQLDLISTYPFPTSEWAVPKLDRVGDTFYVITEDQTDKTNRLYVFDQNMNLLNQVVLEESDDIAIDHFLWLNDRIFTTGTDIHDPLNLDVRSVNYRFYNHDGTLLDLRTEDLELSSMEFSDFQHNIYTTPFGTKVDLFADIRIVVTNHSQVTVETYNLVSRPLPTLEPIPIGCSTFLEYARRNDFSSLEAIGPGESYTLFYDQVRLGIRSEQDLNAWTDVDFCTAVYNPNHFIDKDRSNDHYCASYSYFINDIIEQSATVFQIQKQNGVWTAFGVREAQIELFDLTGRLLLRSISTEDQFFLPELNEHTGISLVRITKGSEQLIQKLSGF